MQTITREIKGNISTVFLHADMDADVRASLVNIGAKTSTITEPITNSILNHQCPKMTIVDSCTGAIKGNSEGGIGLKMILPGNRLGAIVEEITSFGIDLPQMQQNPVG